jgi:D-methionine transport system ATP-binding protein
VVHESLASGGALPQGGLPKDGLPQDGLPQDGMPPTPILNEPSPILENLQAEPIISFRHVSKIFPGSRKRGEVRALDDVTFDINAGEIFGVIGYSGAGKSTLVRLINGLERPTSGQVIVDGIEVSRLSEGQLRSIRADIGMVFQQFNLLNSRTVAGNVSYPLEVAGKSRVERATRVTELLEYVGIADKAGAYPKQLSGGQRQRVGIARALATSPHILLADEATSALDPETTQDVLRLLKKVNSELGITIVVITHAMSVVRTACDRVAVMENGKVVELGNTYSIFADPHAPMTRKFVGTALQDKPAGDSLARLRNRHPGRLITVTVADGVASSSSSEIFRVLGRHAVDAAVVYGGITEVGDRPYGSLTLELTAPDAADIEAAVAEIAMIAGVEDLGARSSSARVGVRPANNLAHLRVPRGIA